MKTPRPNTKSPVALARAALAEAQTTLPSYASKYSRKDFTQHQLYAILALRSFFHTDFRGVEQLLRDWTDLRDALRLKRVPDHSTIHRAANRLAGKAA
jgi:hypothetical protein